jgi:acetoacetyl-CoA synthetase
MYSSGTTGLPKCMVHGAGGTLIQHLKEHALHCDVKRDDNIYYFTTLGWMMWNWLVSGLASGATVILFDGSPFYPDPGAIFQLAEDEKMTLFGTSARYIASVEKAGLKPRENTPRTLPCALRDLPEDSFDSFTET